MKHFEFPASLLVKPAAYVRTYLNHHFWNTKCFYYIVGDYLNCRIIVPINDSLRYYFVRKVFLWSSSSVQSTLTSNFSVFHLLSVEYPQLRCSVLGVGWCLLCAAQAQVEVQALFLSNICMVFRPVLPLGNLLFIHALTNATDDHKYSPLPSQILTVPKF